MNKKTLLILLMGGFAVSCQRPQFNTDVTPPLVEDTLAKVYPEVIGEQKRELSRLSLGEGLYGTQAEYGGVAQIQVVQAGNDTFLEDYWVASIEPRLAKYPIKELFNKNGRKYVEATGAGGEQLIVWTNETWVFSVETSTKEYLNEVASKFEFLKKQD